MKQPVETLKSELQNLKGDQVHEVFKHLLVYQANMGVSRQLQNISTLFNDDENTQEKFLEAVQNFDEHR